MNVKNIFSVIIDSILIALLVPAAIWCLVSAFDMNFGFNAVAFCSIAAVVASVLVCVLIKTGKNAAVFCAVAFAALALFLFLQTDTLINQLEYMLNKVLCRYSEYLPVPQSLSLGNGTEIEATALLCFVECVLIFLFSYCVIKLRTSVPVVIISLTLVVPCFILVNTCPDTPALFVVIACLSALLIASGARRHGRIYSGVISAASFAVMIGILCIVYAFNTPDGFSREPWQDELLINIRQTVGLEQKGDGPQQNSIGSNDIQEVDLNKAGELTQTHEVVMQAYTDEEQALYLRGTAYANYENNKWSTLTDEQYMACPSMGAWNPFYSYSLSGGDMTMKIVTKNTQDVVYMPYYLSEKPIGVSQYADMYLYNQERKKSYNLNYRTYPVRLDLDEGHNYITDSYEEYSSFVYENYTQISDELSEELRFIGKRNGLDEEREKYYNALSSYYDPESDVQRQPYNDVVAEFIREFVSSSAQYSLNTPPVPQGKDIASYLLEDDGMDTAYCVHFATAAAMMLRAYGVPSRYVTGYLVNVTGDAPYTTITTDNAHAWVEYFSDGIGWVPLEATPAGFTPAATQADPIEEETKPTEAQSETQQDTTLIEPSAAYVTKEITADYTGLVLPAVAASILLAIGVIMLRCAIIRAIRRRRFYTGGTNRRAANIYRYIKRCAKYSKQSVPQEIYDIAAKATFSRRRVTPAELDTLLDYAEKAKAALYKNSSLPKRIYYAVFAVI